MFTSTRKNMVMTGGSRRVDKMLNGVLKALGRADKAIGRTAKITLALPIVAISLIGISARPGQATETTIEPMPAKLETRFALSALPPALRDQASVYLLDPEKGYQLSRQGTSGVTCLVERTAWELADFPQRHLYSSLLRRRGHKDLPESHYGHGGASRSGNEPCCVES